MSGEQAPGHPGIAPTWCSSAKDLVTTGLGPSRLWATLGHGIVNEVYWPSTGQPQIRDLGFIVAGRGRWFELKRLNRYELSIPAPLVLLPNVVHHGKDFSVELEILPDDLRDALLLRYRLQGEGYRLYVLLAPRLGSQGGRNTAWVGDGGLYARGDGAALCCHDQHGFLRASAGFVGRSDGWQDFARHGAMTWTWPCAADGNVALLGELAATEGVLGLGFAARPAGARTLVRSSLAEDYARVRARVAHRWRDWGRAVRSPRSDWRSTRGVLLSTGVLKCCEDRHYPGAVVASLSIPWGNARDDLGGYHLVWARDSVESGLAMLAVGHLAEARRMVSYLIATQQPDGHWTQNFYPDGTPFWTGVQLDEAAFPVLLAAKLRETDQPSSRIDVARMVRQAVRYLVRAGPVSPQDRWEENAGISPFTLAVVIAALVAAAGFLEDPAERAYALAWADYLNRRIEDWLYVEGGALAAKYGVPGHYIRLATPAIFGGSHGMLPIANRGGLELPAAEVVSLDFLYLSRLGLRRPDDTRIAATLAVAEGKLCVDTPSGPGFRRYIGDGYGEHENGAPFDGSGRGRLWPLLTGERGHHAVQLGEDGQRYLETMGRMAGRGGLLPEQVWDADVIPARGLAPGRPTGSAMPLVWAHAEFIKLAAAIDTGRPLELLREVERRYGWTRPEPRAWHWRTDAPFGALPRDIDILIEADHPFRLHYGFDGWQQVEEREAAPAPFGLHALRLGRDALAGHRSVEFTLRTEAGWEGRDHCIRIGL